MYLLKTYLFLYRDFQSLSVKLDEKKASLQDLYKCYLGAKHVKRLIKSLDEMSSNLINETFVGPMSRKADALSNFIGLVEATLDMVRKKNLLCANILCTDEGVIFKIKSFELYLQPNFDKIITYHYD